MKRLFLAATLAPSAAFASKFDRPVPQAQSATAELWFLIASLSLIGSLYLVHWLVMRK